LNACLHLSYSASVAETSCRSVSRPTRQPNGWPPDHRSLSMGQCPVFLIRDNDGAYGEVFKRRLRANGHPRSTNFASITLAERYVERVIGSIRRECLDHVVVWSEAHLRRVLTVYTSYYNAARTHLCLRKDAPNPPANREPRRHNFQRCPGPTASSYCRI